MRAKTDLAYSRLLENIGNGKINGKLQPHVILPHENLAKSIDEVINFTYDGILDKVHLFSILYSYALLFSQKR